MSDKICNTPAVDRLFSESGYIGGVPDIMREMNWSMFELCTDVLMTILQVAGVGVGRLVGGKSGLRRGAVRRRRVLPGTRKPEDSDEKRHGPCETDSRHPK